LRKLLVVLTVLLVEFVVLNRQRLFLRDPLAAVRRDGVKVDGVAVLINASNDVLLEDRSTGPLRVLLVQHWNQLAATPTAPMRCVGALACLTDADQATAVAIPAGSRGRRAPFEGVTMTDRRVEFVDGDGALVQVMLR
jgi:hypothetical protein